MNITNSATQIIEKMGGTLKVAVMTNVHQVTVERWCRKNIIPQKYWGILGISASYSSKKTK
jgi:hypothetical protein